jgi:hypothetical protein
MLFSVFIYSMLYTVFVCGIIINGGPFFMTTIAILDGMLITFHVRYSPNNEPTGNYYQGNVNYQR